MLKKFFVAVIIGLFMLSAQLASAEIPVDWNKAPRFNNRADLARYIESERRKGETKFFVVLTDGLKTEDPNDFLSWAPAPHVEITWTYFNDKTAQVIYKIKEYSGTRVANAYLSGKTAWLSQEEMQLYKVAVDIVKEAKKISSPIKRERFIYDTICNRSTFYTEKNMDNAPNFTNAIGVLVDGKANCQGYTDAFYMLGRMCGFNVGRIIGNKGEHAWNWIEFDDGRTYCVDTTKGDDSVEKNIYYVYFNAPLEIMKPKHSWQWELIPKFQTVIDNRYAYRSLDELKQLSSAEDGLKFIAEKFAKENKKIVRVMTPFDERFSEANVQKAVDYIVDELNARKYNATFNLNVFQCGNYLFFTAMII